MVDVTKRSFLLFELVGVKLVGRVKDAGVVEGESSDDLIKMLHLYFNRFSRDRLCYFVPSGNGGKKRGGNRDDDGRGSWIRELKRGIEKKNGLTIS